MSGLNPELALTVGRAPVRLVESFSGDEQVRVAVPSLSEGRPGPDQDRRDGRETQGHGMFHGFSMRGAVQELVKSLAAKGGQDGRESIASTRFSI